MDDVPWKTLATCDSALAVQEVASVVWHYGSQRYQLTGKLSVQRLTMNKELFRIEAVGKQVKAKDDTEATVHLYLPRDVDWQLEKTKIKTSGSGRKLLGANISLEPNSSGLTRIEIKLPQSGEIIRDALEFAEGVVKEARQRQI